MINCTRDLLNSLLNAKTLAFDYDGTLAPVSVNRSKSHVIPEVAEVLSRLRRYYKIIIVTTKDCQFIIRRTPFAHMWVCSNGFEVRFHDDDLSIIPSKILSIDMQRFEKILDKALSIAKKYNLTIELKNVGIIKVGFCIDWRKKMVKPPKDIIELLDEARTSGLSVIEYPNRPFIDIFLTFINKGWAIEKLLKLNIIERPLAYFGDSENDLPAFKLSDISIQVVHEENKSIELKTMYRVDQKDLASILKQLESVISKESNIST